MRKLLIVGLAVFTLASCKKNYTCEYTLVDTTYKSEYKELDKNQAKAAKSSCEEAGGTFSVVKTK
jgi:major membrane immunogen (membrane-anchored lipoprotein)